jgi:hypothetical protein
MAGISPDESGCLAARSRIHPVCRIFHPDKSGGFHRRVVKMATTSVLGLRHELDHDGCAYGQVSRERLTHVGETVEAVNQKVNYVLAAVGLQLVSFVLGVIAFLLYHLPAGR